MGTGVSIIIVNYNVTNEVRDCLLSIEKYVEGIEHEMIVVDNNSPDRTVIELEKEYPKVRFFFLNENLGYSKANNFGVEKARYAFVLFLNPDTVLIENFLKPLLDYCIENSQAGACAPMLLYKDFSYQNSWGPKLGFLYEFAEAFFFINLFRKFMKNLKRKKYESGKPFRVNWMSGACLLMKKNVFNRVGCFNTEYFLNYEDIDLCNRIDSGGFVNLYFPKYRCIHLDQTSQKRDLEKFTFSRYKSRLIYARNNYGFLKRFTIRFIHILGLFLRLVFVKFVYKNDEKTQRYHGYKLSLKLYLRLNYK